MTLWNISPLANFSARFMHFNPIKRADSAESIRAFESFPFISAHGGIASFAAALSSRQPFQLFRRVSWILLLNGASRVYRMSSITQRYDMVAARITSPSNHFTGANIDGRATINLAYVSGGERFKSKAITHRLPYPVNRASGAWGETGPFNGPVSSNKLNRGRIVWRAIPTVMQERAGRKRRIGGVSSWLPRYTTHLDVAAARKTGFVLRDIGRVGESRRLDEYAG